VVTKTTFVAVTRANKLPGKCSRVSVAGIGCVYIYINIYIYAVAALSPGKGFWRGGLGGLLIESGPEGWWSKGVKGYRGECKKFSRK